MVATEGKIKSENAATEEDPAPGTHLNSGDDLFAEGTAVCVDKIHTQVVFTGGEAQTGQGDAGGQGEAAARIGPRGGGAPGGGPKARPPSPGRGPPLGRAPG